MEKTMNITFSSEIMEEAKRVKAMHITNVVADDEWQELRLSLRGNWKNNHLRNVAALRAYFDKYPNDPLAVRRLVNVLTGSVHRAGHTAGQKETDQLRKEVRIKWRSMLGEEIDMNDPRYARGIV